MKWPSVVSASIDPFVFQWYKTFWTFAASFLVLIFWDFEFTWWGLISGFLWVPAGVAAVVAVQHVGIACGQPIWQATIILTSFFWGFMILRDEKVHDWWGTAASLLSLLVGVLGMTFAFNLRRDVPVEAKFSAHSFLESGSWASGMSPRRPPTHSPPGQSSPGLGLVVSGGDRQPGHLEVEPTTPCEDGHEAQKEGVHRSWVSAKLEPLVRAASSGLVGKASRKSIAVGVGAALFNGLWGGANLVPSHFSPYKGVHFQISFGVGALIANVVVLVLYALVLRCWWGRPMPSFHLRTMAVPGFVSGMLWCAGNFCALYAVSTIGQGIGYSLVQCNGIVSGLWGILYYGELRGRPIALWCVACMFCCMGVLGLAAERAA